MSGSSERIALPIFKGEDFPVWKAQVEANSVRGACQKSYQANDRRMPHKRRNGTRSLVEPGLSS